MMATTAVEKERKTLADREQIETHTQQNTATILLAATDRQRHGI